MILMPTDNSQSAAVMVKRIGLHAHASGCGFVAAIFKSTRLVRVFYCKNICKTHLTVFDCVAQ